MVRYISALVLQHLSLNYLEEVVEYSTITWPNLKIVITLQMTIKANLLSFNRPREAISELEQLVGF
jgi:hypothetical protein